MNARGFMRLAGYMVLSAACLAGSAVAQPKLGEPAGDAEDRARARTDDSRALAPALDRSLLQRLQELESARRTARRAGLKDPKAWQENIAQRASAHRQQLAALWGNVVDTIDGQARLRVHADRMARLNRILDLAEQKNEKSLVTTIDADIASELARHVQAMQQLIAEVGLP